MLQFLSCCFFSPHIIELFIMEVKDNTDYRYFSKSLIDYGSSYLKTEPIFLLQSINFHQWHKNMHTAYGLPTGSIQNCADGCVHNTDEHRDMVMSAVPKGKIVFVVLVVLFSVRFCILRCFWSHLSSETVGRKHVLICVLFTHLKGSVSEILLCAGPIMEHDRTVWQILNWTG